MTNTETKSYGAWVLVSADLANLPAQDGFYAAQYKDGRRARIEFNGDKQSCVNHWRDLVHRWFKLDYAAIPDPPEIEKTQEQKDEAAFAEQLRIQKGTVSGSPRDVQVSLHTMWEAGVKYGRQTCELQ